MQATLHMYASQKRLESSVVGRMVEVQAAFSVLERAEQNRPMLLGNRRSQL